ncbi:unnamed protein product [Brassicogethes aeneus]|uniref:Glucose-methanol-choline oxidoreductase N-terminal domain-containing protein n=1 Tax=Brassicogethes aeneus TaxID=1431903 RepID=A0A9P0FDA5_BRAAE|nr:unnamed protein product [Brassicogethes aeneus]
MLLKAVIYMLFIININVNAYINNNKIESLSIEEQIKYYENLINKKNGKSFWYQVDDNAARYKADASHVEAFGDFDFIIVGSGAAGSVLAKRLSEIEEWKVLLIEAGDLPDETTRMPAFALANMASDYNWGFYSVPQKEGCQGFEEKRCQMARGRGVGGSTLINGAILARSNPKDLDQLNEIVEGWSYKDMLPYMMKFEKHNKNRDDAPSNPEYHSTKGEFPSQFNSINNSRTDAFYKGCQQLGYKYTDYNSGEQVGCSPLQFFIDNGRRVDAGTAFVLPILDKPNFKLMTKSLAIKIKIDPSKKNAEGVYFSHSNMLYYAGVRKEVILSAGAFQSPQLLMLSGVGAEEHLESLGIKTLFDLPVGKNLRDHHSMFFVAQHNQTDDNFKSDIEDIEDYINGHGRLTADQGIASVLWFPTKIQEDKTRPDTEFMMMPFFSTTTMINNNFRFSFSSIIAQVAGIELGSPFMLGVFINLKTKSVGSVTLQSSSPYDYPLIDPNIFGDRDDLEHLYQIYLGVREHFHTPAMQAVAARMTKLSIPKCNKFSEKSRKYWYCVFKHFAFPTYHPIGTCSMGTDPKNSVTDKDMKVHHLNNLRVCDASIFPFTQSHNPVVIIMAAAEKLADTIKKSYNI